MNSSALCSYCSKINFEALKNPLLSDLPALEAGRVDTSRHPFKKRQEDAHYSTLLGPFGSLLQRSKACRLCQLIVHALSGQKARQLSEKDVCTAETSFYGLYRDSRGGNFWVRRLSILVEIMVDAYGVGGPKKSLFYVFQACDVGAASAPVDGRFADPGSGSDKMIFGGRRRPLLLDLQWVHRWMEICKTEHGATCERADVGSKNTLEWVRFVDVQQMCIVTLKDVRLSEQEYIVLSYVWGGPQKLQLELQNKDELSKPGALATKTLPQTLADSIFLTEKLGFQYLWIDALCIVQDDDDDKKVQIHGMSQIYSFGFLTIVAASTSSVDGGLPGIHPGTRTFEQQEVIVIPPTTTKDANPGLSLMTALNPALNPSEHYLERTPWNSRGWTLQERVMSRRALVFLEEQVYWVCREATFCEESYFENSKLRFSRFHEGAAEPTLQRRDKNFYEPDDDQAQFWRIYQSLVAKYTRRTFTYGGDAFDGFLSVLQGLSALSGDHFAWGLPRSHFEQGLLWSSFSYLKRRTEKSTLPMTSMNVKVPFPSWSWIGWSGEAHICIGDERWDFDVGEIPEILCYEHQHSPLRIERVRSKTLMYELMRTRQSRRPKWKPGSSSSSNDPVVTLADLATQHPSLQLSTIPETQFIFFWTSCASFDVVVPDSDNAHHGSIIVDSHGDVVGSTGPMESDSAAKNPSSKGKQEFIVMGSRRNQFSDPMLLVLQVEWRDAVAHRVNWGEIKEEAWEREGHSWKLIPLG